jgi:hypothetical protein
VPGALRWAVLTAACFRALAQVPPAINQFTKVLDKNLGARARCQHAPRPGWR